MLLLKFFSRRWWFATLLVIAATLVMIRLGIWQLDRLEGRRAFNAQVTSARAMPLLDLNTEQSDDLISMEWRAVQVSGTYDFENQIALRNKYNANRELGYHLLTPLLFSGTAVLVDRGWIPADSSSAPADWRTFDEPGTVTITGQLRVTQAKPSYGGTDDTLPTDGSRLWTWWNTDLEKIGAQLPYPILPIFIQPNTSATDGIPPIPYQPTIELTEGPHFGYAIQWFTFATILFLGYPFFVKQQESKSK